MVSKGHLMFEKTAMCEVKIKGSSYYASKVNRLEVVVVRECAAGLSG
jgi:hypothetical protein